MRNPLVFAALLCFVYGLLLEYGPKPVQAIMQSQWQDNQFSIEKYLRDSKSGHTQHKVVFVGSSLTQRLDFDGESNCVYNLSLQGDSALTGLSVIANSVENPRQVFIEINVPQNGVNQDLINRGTALLPHLLPIFHVENMPINLALSFLHHIKNEKPVNVSNDTVNLNALALQVRSYKELLPPENLSQNMGEFRRLVRDIESKGSKIVFFEMPVHPELENSPRAIQIRNAFKNLFQNYRLLSFQELSNPITVITADGLHLHKDEAITVVRNIKVHLKEVCENKNDFM